MQIAGVVFPVPILLLIPAREFLLPRIFGRKNLAVLDPAPFEDSGGQLRKRRSAHANTLQGRPSTEIAGPGNAAYERSAENPTSRATDSVL